MSNLLPGSPFRRESVGRGRVVALAAVLAVGLVVGGCATGTGVDGPSSGSGASGSGGGPPDPSLDAYDFRAPLTLQGVPDGATVRVVLNHATLVADGKALADGNDVRIVFFDDGGSATELNRVLDRASAWDSTNTNLFFRALPAPAPSGVYYVYYGNPTPAAPVADPLQVFDYWDDFDTLEENWGLDLIGPATGDVSLVSGAVRVAGVAGDIGGAADDCILFARDLSGDFLIEARIAGVGGSL
ncbi:MAG: hypothetical protein KC731_12880, partial [Myxococcales bacterium]|nr:hypothetical protein [Myxococcales bacterium]